LDVEVIKSYLVSLGFEVHHPELRKFQDALRTAGQDVERFTGGMLKGFVGAGTAVAAALTGVATATLGLIDHVAQADLGYQVFARRMYMNVDAAKQLKIATDALGYSLEDIVWGPKELRERYGALVADQKRMSGGLGPDFEKQMRGIRDVRFEFTRLQVEAQYLGMSLVANLARTFLGGDDKIRDKIHAFNEWLINNLPRISQELSERLAPILKDVARIWMDIKAIATDAISIMIRLIGTLYGDEKMKSGAVNLENIGLAVRHIADSITYVFDKLRAVSDWAANNPAIARMLGFGAAGAVAGTAVPGVGTLAGGVMGIAAGALSLESDKGDIYRAIQAQAKAMGVDPDLALAIAEKESNFNPKARGSKGEIGLFQLMPSTAAGMGIDPNDPAQNIKGGLQYLLEQYGRYHDWGQAIKHYNGTGPAADAYSQDVQRIWGINRETPRHFDPDAMYTPQAYHPGSSRVDVGGITVHVTQPHATAEEIAAAVSRKMDDKFGKQAQRNIVQFGGSYA
jgi:soluble lytic murein transglycosylase-like protein